MSSDVYRLCHHQYDIAVHHRVITGGYPDQTGHAHVKRVVELNEFFPAQRMDDWCLQPARKLDQFRVRSGTAHSTKNCYLLRRIENLRQFRNFIIGAFVPDGKPVRSNDCIGRRDVPGGFPENIHCRFPGLESAMQSPARGHDCDGSRRVR